MSIVPNGDRILVTILDEQTTDKQTGSGLYLPSETRKTRQKKGSVVAVGRGRLENGKRIPMDIKEKDIVLFDFGEEVSIDNQDYVILREVDVLAILT